ncbi:MAG: hypothetical protein JRI50_11520 [Deltaproteobacteria bacterium]|nr:hypothetical protein [Deltaproteobacteria bacterium]
MANVFLLIGVGGTGRGVLNYVKYDLEKSYGELKKARTVLLAIDGPPPPSQYALPGGYEIDCRPGSPEFYQLSDEVDPAEPIERIAAMSEKEYREGTYSPPEDKYIGYWLSPPAAAKIHPDIIKPSAGFGGQPAPSHVYVHLDTDRLARALGRAYNESLSILRGQIGEGEHGPGQQVIVCLMGSHSGGTGSGMLWDIAHHLANRVSQYNDLLFAFIPWGKSYHKHQSSQDKKLENDAKNFAGLLSGIRFMNADARQRSYLAFNDQFKFLTPQLFAVPFFLDGEGSRVKINDVFPREGVVPAIADFLTTLIKDNLSTGRFSHDLINWAHDVANTEKPKKYATFGSYSIRYPAHELLETFAYKFTYEIYNEILNYQPGRAGKGETLARQVLNDLVFTSLLTDVDNAKLAPQEVKILGDTIKVGRLDAIPPGLIDLEELVNLRTWVLIKRTDEAVIAETEDAMADLRVQAERFLKTQQPKIVATFINNVNEELLSLFYHRDNERWRAITLQENPNTILWARDFLAYLRNKADQFYDFLEREYEKYYYPDGRGQPDLISQQQSRVEEKKRIMHASPGKETEEQEDYLYEATVLLRYQVWQKYIIGVQGIMRMLKEHLNYLWNQIGEDAEGWVTLLRGYMNDLNVKYTGDLSRRLAFTKLRLREYLPEPGGSAEEQLFDELGDPELETLLSHMHWTMAIDAEDPQKITLVLNSPTVKGFQYATPKRYIIDPATKQKVPVGIYDPQQHVAYAKQVFAPKLEATSLWKIMEMDFRYDWLADQGIVFDRLSLPEARNLRWAYVDGKIDTLFTQSEPLLVLSRKPKVQHPLFIADFRRLGADSDLDSQAPEFRDQGGELAHFLTSELERRIGTIKGSYPTHNSLKHELRVAIPYLLYSIKDWSYFDEARAGYLTYHHDPNKPLINIYAPEQQALKVRQIIQDRLDRSFQELLDPGVTALLENWEIFTKLSLCYIRGLIESKSVSSALTVPPEYYLPHPTGDIYLAAVGDMEGLYRTVCRIAIWENNLIQPNDLVHQKIKEKWSQEEQNHLGNKTEFLNQVENAGLHWTLPVKPRSDLNQRHLELAIKAAILDYIARARAVQLT